MIRHLPSDLRVALRRLARRPLATLTAAATLAIGIGGSVAVLALIESLFLRPLGFPAPDRLVTVWDRGTDGAPENLGWPTVVDYRDHVRSFSDVAALAYWSPTATGAGGAELLEGLRVSDGFFRLLGVQPAIGRFFTPEEDVRGNHRVVVLSYGLWQRRFAGDPGAVGRTMHFGEAEYRIVGVLPADFEPIFSTAGRPLAEIFAPLAYDTSLPWACRDCRHLRAIARLRPGVPLAAAREEASALGIALAHDHPQDYAAPGGLVVPLQEQLFGDRRSVLFGLLGAVALVLLLATANVAGQELAAAVPRREELLVRAALGARRRDLVRLRLLESGCLGGLGALLGLGVARATLGAVLALAPIEVPRLQRAVIDWRALLVAVGLGMVAALLAGAAPALAAGRTRLTPARGSTAGRERHRALAWLVAGDIALGVVLLAGAGLFEASLLRLLEQAPGFRPERLLTLDLNVAGPRAESGTRTAELYEQLVAEVSALPGVRAAAVASQIPLGGSVDRYSVHAEGRSSPNPELDPAADRYGVSAGYLETMGTPLRLGRTLTPADGEKTQKVALVSEALARRVWRERSPLGQRLKVGGLDGPWWTVVGVVGDIRHDGLEATSAGAIYLPLAQWSSPETSVSLVVRAAGEPRALASAVRAVLAGLDRDVAVSRVATMDDWIAARSASRRFTAQLLAGFALIALLLAALGVHGVVALAVGARRRELGVRRALGATDGEVVRLLLRGVLAMALPGAALGLVGALVFGRLLRAELYGVSPAQPEILAAVLAVLLAVAVAAALGPARRAIRGEPAEILRDQ